MTTKRFFYPAFLILTSIWLGWTILVDFFVVRTVFAHVSNFFEAGELGIALFSKLNSLEVVVSSSLLAMTVMLKRKGLFLLVPVLICWLIVMFCFSYLIPKITFLTEVWRNLDVKGITPPAGISDPQQDHQFLHNLYIKMDAVKLVLQCSMIIISFKFRERFE